MQHIDTELERVKAEISRCALKQQNIVELLDTVDRGLSVPDQSELPPSTPANHSLRSSAGERAPFQTLIDTNSSPSPNHLQATSRIDFTTAATDPFSPTGDTALSPLLSSAAVKYGVLAESPSPSSESYLKWEAAVLANAVASAVCVGTIGKQQDVALAAALSSKADQLQTEPPQETAAAEESLTEPEPEPQPVMEQPAPKPALTKNQKKKVRKKKAAAAKAKKADESLAKALADFAASG